MLSFFLGYYGLSFCELHNQSALSFFETDEAVYAWQAELIHSDFATIISDQVNEYHPFLFPLILSIGKSLFPQQIPPVIVYRCIVLMISLLAVLLLITLSLKISGKFLAVFCAIGLLNNPIFFTFKFFILNDVLLMCFCILLFINLYTLQLNSSWKKHACIGIIASSAILTKWVGILLIPIVFLWYVAQPEKKERLQELKKFFQIPGIIILTTIILVTLNKYIQTDSLFPNLSAFGHTASPGTLDLRRLFVPMYYNFFYIPFKEMSVFFFIGIFFAVYRKQKFFLALIIMIAVGITGDLLLKQTNPRYVLYLQPAFLLLTGFGIESLLKTLIKNPWNLFIIKIALILFYIVLIIGYFPQILHYFYLKTAPINHADTGRWIKTNSSENFLIIAQDRRPIRYFTNYDYAEDGGNIYPCPTSRNALKQTVQKTNRPLILELNLQRERLLSDFKPFSDPKDSSEFLQSLGFSLRKTCFSNNAGGRYPSVKIFVRNESDSI